MTKHLLRPSLFQARDSVSPSSASPVSHLRSHSRSHAHQHLHHAQARKHTHGHARDATDNANHNNHGDDDDDSGDDNLAATKHSDIDTDHTDSQSSGDLISLDLREPVAVVEADFVARQNDNDPLVTHVVQTVSVIQLVDHNGSPIATQTHYAPPATVVVNSSSGETVKVMGPGVTAEAGAGNILGSLLPGAPVPPSSVSPASLSQSLSPSSHTTTSTHYSISTSLHSDSTLTPAPSVSIYPTLSDVANGTALPGNLTIATGSSNSTIRPLLFSAPSSQNLSTTHGNHRIYSTSSFLSTTDLSTSFLTPTSTATSTGADAAGSTVAEGFAPTAEADDSPPLTPQQKQVIGGVVGGIAGVAFIALLALLLLRYKRRRDAQSPDSTSTRGFATIGDGSSGATGSMAERNGAASAVTAAFASLTGKQRSGTTEAPPPAGERGFYRVSGRKLPSVLHAGGDGYSDPRVSAMSAQTQLSRDSQMSDAFGPGSTPYALGTPMRPVSGVPIMRSGPARTPVTESNPFADPPPSPPTPPSPLYESPPRSFGSRGSPRASGSRFQESI